MFERHGQRFAFWTDEARNLLQGILQPVYRALSLRKSIFRLSMTAPQRKRDWWTFIVLGSEEHLVLHKPMVL
ncbi:hypothetical protein G5714_008991 [Onychostoma macrolepis]|uniref:Uncharacterized protein n=1 Tax=Onychostoma macrolepis TaxID=369639 RepID=A0A7J6CQW8_9TELE|nr:hypothetical protein G5714_008991 [Onychostoma macrolepis]